MVLFETEPWQHEKILPNDIAFDNHPDTKYYRCYSPNAEFIVKRVELAKGVAYDLMSPSVSHLKNK